MEAAAQRRSCYRARPARRPMLFWWQAFLLLGVIAFLWYQLPVTAVFFETRPLPGVQAAHAAYWVLDPHYAARAFKKPLTAWTSGGSGGRLAPGLDISGFDFGQALPPPDYLEQGERYPGVWHPAAVSSLPGRLPDLRISSAAHAAATEGAPASAPQGVAVMPDRVLQRASFAFPVPTLTELSAEHEGHCRFYVETDAEGRVAHVLLLTPRTDGAAVFERALICGQASGVARGTITINWMVSKP